MSFLSNIIGAALAFFSGPVGWVRWALAAAVFASGTYADMDARRRARNARKDYNASLQDRFQMVKGSTVIRSLVYGRARVSGAILFVHSTGDKQQYLHLVIALAGHEVDEVKTLYLNDKALPAPNPTTGLIESGDFALTRTAGRSARVSASAGGAFSITLPLAAGETLVRVVGVTRTMSYGANSLSAVNAYTLAGNVVSGTAGPDNGSYTTNGIGVAYEVSTITSRVRVRTHLGGTAGGQPFPELVAESGGKWSTGGHLCRGIAAVYVRLEFDQDMFGQTGLPNISAVVRGRKLYDPRLDSTAGGSGPQRLASPSTWTWSDNAALAVADYLRDSTYGLGATAAEMPAAELITAANIADELVTLTPGGATQRRYTANGVLSSDTSRRNNLDLLLEGLAGTVAWSQGRWLLRAGAHRAPVLTITESMLAGNGPQIQPWAARTDLINRVIPTHAAADAGYTEVQAPAVSNALYLADDGGIDLPMEVTYEMCTDAMRAQRLGKIALERARQAMTVQLTCNLKAYDLSPSDVVAVTLARYGWTSKLFEVSARTLDLDTMTVGLSLRETAAGVWDWNYGEASTVDLTPNTTLPNPLALVAPPAGLDAVSGTAQLLLAADGSIVTRALVSWLPVSDIFVAQAGQIQLQWRPAASDDWATASPATGDSLSAFIGPLPDGGQIYIRARAVNSLGRASDWIVIPHTVIGKTAAPGNVGSITYSVEPFGVRLNWSDVLDLDLAGYELRTGGTSWETATALDTSRGTTYLWAVQAVGSVVVRVKAVDTSGNYSTTATSVTVNIVAPAAPSVSATITGADELISWTVPAAGFALDRYEVRQGASFGAGTPVASVKGSSLRRRVDYVGARTYWVAAIDAAGNVGAAGSVAINIAAPGVPTASRQEVIDNNVLLYWSAPASGSLPIDRYEIRKGASFAGGTVIGSNAASTFTVVFEQQAGSYTYWIAAVDTAGNVGTAGSIVATVNQPPDYVLRTNIDSTFTGTKTNVAAIDGDLYAPINTTETWSTHYSTRAWANPQAQISAGFPVYLQPSLTTGSYDENWDAGAVLPATTIVATVNTTTVTGSVAMSVQIYYKTAIGDAWTAATAGATSVLASGFRYYRVVLTFTATAGANLLRINSLNVKLSSKQRTDSGTGTITNAGTGLAVTFNAAFIDADTPVVQPNGTTPLVPVVDFTDAPNPTGFTVKLYTLAGVATTGSFSWTARGY